MKRYILSAVLGITTLTAFGQGGIVFNNGPSGGPYNPIIWGGLTPAPGQGVKSTDGAVITLWYGEGALNEALLVPGPVVTWNSGFEAGGYYGYYTVQVTLPTWNPGDVFTFQLRASGNSIYGTIPDAPYTRSIVWTENANIAFIGGVPSGPPGMSQNSIGFAIGAPEPSTFALSSIGLAGLWLFRRRNGRAL